MDAEGSASATFAAGEGQKLLQILFGERHDRFYGARLTSLLHIPPSFALGVGLLCNLMIRIGGQSMLLNSTGVIAKSQREEESALLRRKVEELNKNTARLIVEAGKLIQESKQLSAQVKSLETPARS